MAIPIIVPLIAVGVAGIATAVATNKSTPVQSSKPNRRRTKDDYAGTSFTYNHAPLQALQPLQPLKSKQRLQPIGAIKPLQAITPRTTFTAYNNPTYDYYNDPYQVNSLADVLLNKEGKNLVLEDLGMEKFTNIPVLQEIIVGVDYIKRQYVDPIQENGLKGFAEAGINALVSSGETLDIITNPLKGLVLDGPDGFIRGLGIGSEGRTQYDFNAEFGDSWFANTGEFLVNLIAEIAIDPLNWMTMGGKALVSESLTTGGKVALKEAAEETGQVVTKKTARQLNRNMRAVARSYLKDGDIATDAVLTALNKIPGNTQFKKTLVKNLSEQVNNVSSRKIVKGAAKLFKTANNIDDAILLSTPLGVALKGVGFGISNVSGSVKNWMGNTSLRRFKKAINDAPSVNKLLYDSELTDTLTNVDKTITKQYTKEVLPEFDTLVKVYQQTKQTGEALDSVDSFVRKLVDEKVINSEVGNRLVLDKEFETYFESILQKGEAVDALQKALLDESTLIDSAVNEAIIKSTNTYDMIENVTAVYRRFFDNLDESLGLNSIDDMLTNSVKKLQKELDALTTTGAAINDIITKEAQIKMLQDVHNNFKKQLRRIGLDLSDNLELPNPQLLKQLKENGSEQAANIVKEKQDALKAEYKTIRTEEKQMLKQLQQIKQDAFEVAKGTKNIYSSEQAATVSFVIEQIESKKNLKTILSLIDELEIDDATKAALSNIVETMLDNRAALRTLNITKKELDSALKFLEKPIKLKEIQESATARTLELMDRYTNKNFETLRKYAINISDVEELMQTKQVSDAQKNRVNKLITKQRQRVQQSINEVLQRLDKFETGDAWDWAKNTNDTVDARLINLRDELRELSLRDNRGIEYAMELLNETGFVGYYDVDAYRNNLLNILYPKSKTAYTLKLNQAYVHRQILNAYEQDPVTKQFILDLANDTNNTVAGNIFNTLLNSDADGAIMPFSVADVKGVKDVSKAHVAYTNLLNRVIQDASKKDPTLGLAFIDGFAGLGYRDKLDIIDMFIKDGHIDYNAVEDLIDMRYNAIANQYCKTNEGLANLLGMDTRGIRTHDAAEDLKMTPYIHQKYIERGLLPTPKDGEIFTYYDLETTGLNKEGKDQMLQIAAKKYIAKDGKLVEYAEPLNIYIKQGRGYNISSGALESFDETFLQNVKHATISEADAIEAFTEYAEGTLAGHNIKGFDNDFFKARSGIDLTERYGILDTLEPGKKMFGARNLDEKSVHKIADALEEYLHVIDEIPTVHRAVQLVDKRAADSLYNVARDLKSFTKGGMDMKDFNKKMQQNIFTESIQNILGKAEVSQVAEELGAFTYKELMDTVTNLDVNARESITTQVKNILTEIKGQNNRFREYIITDTILEELSEQVKVDKRMFNKLGVGLDYQLKLNAFGLTNNIIEDPTGQLRLTRDFQFSEVGLKKINTAQYTNSLKKRIEREVTEPIAVRKQIMADLDILDNPNTDWVTKFEASERLAANGVNYAQASRLKAAIASAASHATSPNNLSDGIKRNIAVGTDEIKTNVDYAMAWSQKASKLNSSTYKQLNQEICINDTISTLGSGMSPQQFTAFITDKAGGLCYIGDITNPRYKKYVDQILADEEIYNELGYLLKVEDNGLYILPYDKGKVIANSQAVAGEYGMKHIKKEYKGHVKELFDETEKIYNKAAAISGEMPIKGTQEFASKVMYIDSFYKLKRGKEHIFAGTLLDDEEWISRFYSARTPRYSYGIVGSLEGRRVFDEMHPQPLNNAITLIEKNIKRVDGRNKFIELFFNNDLGLNSSFYKDLSDKDILDMYKHMRQDNVFAVLVTDKKTGKPFVKTVRPQTVKDIQVIRQMDGIIVPNYNANMLVNSINKELWETKFNCPVLQFYYKYIVSTYKTLALCTPGMLMRNFVDIILKNTMGGTVDEIPDSLSQFFAGVRDWKQYDAMIKEIDTYYNLDANGIARYFKNKEKVLGVDEATRMHDLFNEIHEYATSNVSAGMAESQEQMLKEYYNRFGSRKKLGSNEWYLEGERPSKFDKWFFEENKLRQMSDAILKQNQYLEHGGRIASLRISKARGLNDMEAYSRALNTHFDYGMKSKAQMYAELVFPFVTFPLYNLQYWVDNAIKNPELIELLIDTSRTSLDLEEQKQYTIDNSTKLQAALLNGNVRIGDTLIKLNPSLFDAYQTIVTPASVLEQRMIAPVKLGVTKLKEVIAPTEEQDYVTNIYTNLEKLGLGKLEKNLNDIGLYSITRLTNNVIKGVATLGDIDGLEKTDSLADIVPSMVGDYKQNYGARIGEDFATYKLRTYGGTYYHTFQTQTGKHTKTSYYPSSYSSGSSLSVRPTRYPSSKRFPGRSYKRIPYVRRYYNNSYNWYNRWKAERVHPYYITQPATVESLAYTFKGLLYDVGMNPKILRAYDRKQGYVFKVK